MKWDWKEKGRDDMRNLGKNVQDPNRVNVGEEVMEGRQVRVLSRQSWRKEERQGEGI